MEHSALKRGRQRGQAMMEAVFCLLFLIAFVTALFQALHFELDVFNKTGLLRYKAIHKARESQDTTDPEMITNVTVQGKALSDLTFYKVPLQEGVDLTQHWGPKRLVVRHGSKYWDAAPVHSDWAFAGILTIDHDEDSAGYVGDAFEFLSNIVNNIPF